ncbi:MAG: efflux RND transporter periplasmic adaptor subunit [Prevotella sp.]|nr:efflux RND transporter periplasmic adaptor subunit [Bacteroidales bacterium]MDY4706722.1 efflux RND transporter periplasmic adaptor subunit [Prevotella sp.]MDY4955260.1 efflux RND transporter periplasmic adaptor subunit [Prevotella sp.]MDY5320222.1 efflux RND transporter periplasmic adaptor subunit [Prevotella sp.]
MRIKTILLAAIAAPLLVSCGGKSGGMPNFGDNEFAVRTVEASSASLQTTYPATVKGIHDVEVRPMVSGFITKVCVQEGQAVQKGQLLFTINSETYQAQLRQAQAALNTARSQANTMRLTWQNNKKLFDKHIIGQYELSTSQNSYESAVAQVRQAEASVASAKEMLSYCYVKSPATGYIGSLPYKVGALVSPSISTPLTTVSDISVVEVFFSVPEKTVLSMLKGNGSEKAAIASFPPVKLQMNDGTLYNHPGKVVKMSGVVDPTTGALSVIAHFNNPERLLKSGGSGSIIIPSDESHAILVPKDACSEVQDKVFVYVVGKDNKVKYTEIKVNPEDDGSNYIVTSGLKVGDRYVSKGITKLTDGMQIQPITEEQYNKKIAEAAELSKQQGTASGFVGAMKGK